MTYEVIELEHENKVLKRTNLDGTISWIPMVAGNSDYEAYLNPVEHFTEIVPDEPAAKSK